MLSRMPVADAAKTKLVLKKRHILYGFLVVLALGALLAPTIFYQPPTTSFEVAGQSISLEIASSNAARERGLGGRAHVAANKGMLFVFDKPTATCFWMKDMRFPIDIIWLNAAKQVTYVQPSVAPRTYPKTFCPKSPASYVIELNAGQAQALGISTGKTLNF
jgi:uncharacterized membrane protein (UPF0127 family)